MRQLSVTALARSYDLACPRHFVWMTDGVPREKVRWEETPAGTVLAALGEAHERAVVDRLVPASELRSPDYPEGDLDAGAEATRQLTVQGVPYIYQGVLQGPLSPELAIRGIADLLVRTTSEPRYRVIEVKASRRLRTSQVLQATAYTRLLARCIATEEPLMVDGMYREHPVALTPMEGLLDELVATTVPRWLAAGGDEFHRTTRCSGCPFDPLCRDDARRRHHVSLVAGISPAVATRLRSVGVVGIPGLQTLPHRDLHAAGIDRHLLGRLQGQARALTEGRPVPIADAPGRPKAEIELFLEVEPDPTRPIPCRVGVLKRDTTNEMTAYRGIILPDDPRQAQERVRAYLELVAHQATKAARDHRSWIFLYYGPRTAETLVELVGWAGWGDEVLERILHRAVDIHAVVRRAWHLPVEQYGLVHVLDAVGAAPPPEDQPAFALHTQWRRGVDGGLEQRMIGQGEAQARALMSLWDWLAEGAPHG